MILRWTWKELARSRLRVLASSSAVAAAFALVMVFESIWAGEIDQVVAYIENTEADVWVMQRDVTNMHMASSFIRDTKRDQVAAIDGVARADAVLYMSTLVQAGDRRLFTFIVGLERPNQLGGPWAMARGSSDVSPGGAIIPEALAGLAGVDVGDSITVSGRAFKITGLSEGTFSIANPVIFVHAADLAELLDIVGYDSYLLVTAAAGLSPELLARRIRANIDDVEVLTRDAFAESDRVLGIQMGVEVIAMMTFIGSGLAILLVAFVLFIQTSRMERELAVLKALGFRNRHIYAGVLLQALMLTTLAFVLALGTTMALAVVSPVLLPQLTMKITGALLLKIGAVGLLVATVATLVPARRIGAVDPMSVFRT